MTNERKRKILILDDEPAVVTYLETLLKDNGYDTVCAGDGKVGMDKAKIDRPDLVCLDITMPRRSGIRFYRDLRADPDLKSIPVVVVTAVTGYGGDPESFKKFLSSRKRVPPPEGFVAKPIDREEFIAILRRLLS
ncbi:MAG: response regulator [Candidatus Riflebacteria bacterium]|nr:response regulator [Candidatus Riflebacteria bacterium]